MEKYIALLRGINVGGRNSVPMPLLKAAFEKEGFVEVSTYINSGNVFFSAENADHVTLQKKCRHAVMNGFQLDIAIAVLSVSDLRDALDHAPEWWGPDAESKHNAFFVIAPATAEQVIESVGDAKPEFEKVAHFGSVIFWSAPIRTFSRTRWSKVVSMPVYDSLTIRNANTAKKLGSA